MQQIMKRLSLILLLMIPVTAFGETLLICDAETITFWGTGKPEKHGLNGELTLAFDGDEVEMGQLSESRRTRLSQKDGSIWRWTFDIFDTTRHYILNTISGELEETVTKKGTTEPVLSVIVHRCRRMDQRLVE